MDIVRINTAFVKTQGETEELCRALNRAFERKGREFPVCVDLCGPTIRLTNFPNDEPIELRKGEVVYITVNRHVATTNRILFCDCPRLPFFLNVGDKIIIDYGKTSLTVQSVDKESTILTSIGASSPLKSYKVLPMRKE